MPCAACSDASTAAVAAIASSTAALGVHLHLHKQPLLLHLAEGCRCVAVWKCEQNALRASATSKRGSWYHSSAQLDTVHPEAASITAQLVLWPPSATAQC